MATTTNFGWETPDDTDLVKDGALAMRTLGNAIDTSLVDLKGGTTGQILSKTSNTDMDFTWIANDQGDITAVTAGTGLSGGGTTGAVTLTNDMATTITAAGDIVVGTGSGTYDNLPIGTTGQVLTADTTVSPYKVKWASAAGGGANWSIVNSGGTALTGATTITISSITSADRLMVLISGASTTSGGTAYGIRFNSDSGSNYATFGAWLEFATSYSTNNFGVLNNAGDTQISIGSPSSNAGSALSGWLMLTGGNASGVKQYWSSAMATASTGNAQINGQIGGIWNNSATISSVSIISNSGNFDAGTIYVYKSA